MSSFDGNRYRATVLRPLLDGGRPATEDPFALFAIDLDEDDLTVIRGRVDEVVRFWRGEQSNPRYRNVVNSLIKDREVLAAHVLDSGARASARTRVAAERQRAAESRFEHVDEMLNKLNTRWGGIPSNRIERLREVASRSGVTSAEFDSRLGGFRIIADDPHDAKPPSPEVRSLTRTRLIEFSQLTEDGSQRTVRTLFDFLGLDAAASRAAISAAHERIGIRNRQRRHDRLRTVVDELLALTADLLLKSDTSEYRAGLLADAADLVKPNLETALLLEDRLTALEFERLLREIVANGLDSESARTVLLRAAREVGIAVETGAPVDYILCVSCNATNPVGSADARCEQCGAELYRACPGCSMSISRGAATCKSCRYDLGSLRLAERTIAEAHAAVSAGRVAAAKDLVDQLVLWGGGLDAVDALRLTVETAHQRALADWERAQNLLGQGRFDDAAAAAQSLVAVAHDVPSPSGQLPEEFLAEVAERLSAIRDLVQLASELGGSDRERSLLSLAAQYPDNSEVLSALRQIPVTSPSGLMAVISDTVVRLSWKPSPSPGAISYRVTRVIHGSGETASRSIGSTSETSIEDAGAPAGFLIAYEVQAVRHGIASGKVSTRPRLASFEVSRLTAIEHDGSIELRWTRLGGHSGIWVERIDTTDDAQPTLRHRASDSGWMDTSVRDGHRYAYRVYVDYGIAADRMSTRGVTVHATAFVVPATPEVRCSPLAAGKVSLDVDCSGLAHLVRCHSAPQVAPGTVLDRRALSRYGDTLPPATATSFVDHVDGRVRWYLPAVQFGQQVVVGSALLHTGFAEPSNVSATPTDAGVEVRWKWPPGCTETLLVWRLGAPPVDYDDPLASRSKVTNTVYEIHQGWTLDGPPRGTLHFLIRPGRRVEGQLHPTLGQSPEARTHCTFDPPPAVSYMLSRVGRRRKEIRVELTRAAPETARLVIFAQPMAGLQESAPARVLGEIGPGETSAVVQLSGLSLPAVISVRSGDGGARVRIEDPSLDMRTLQ